MQVFIVFSLISRLTSFKYLKMSRRTLEHLIKDKLNINENKSNNSNINMSNIFKMT